MDRTVRRRSVKCGKNLQFGVGLEVSGPLAVAGGQSQQPQDERSQGGDEQQGLEALGASGARVAQREPELDEWEC